MNICRKTSLITLVILAFLLPVSAIDVETILGQSAVKTDDGFLATTAIGSPAKVIEYDGGGFLVLDTKYHSIKHVNSDGYIQNFAGTELASYEDNTRLKARFKAPYGIVKDSLGNYFISDTQNHVIRKIDKDSNVTTFAGQNMAGFKDGLATEALFNTPMGMAIDKNDNIYIADQRNHRIRKIDNEGNVTTLAGSKKRGRVDAKGIQARFYYPESVALDSDGNLYVADKANHCIRKIDTEAKVTTVTGSTKGYSDGAFNQALFSSPSDIVFDGGTNLYIADYGNNAVRKVDLSSGLVETIAGNGSPGYKDGDAKESYFKSPRTLSLLSSGRLVVADISNYKLRVINLENSGSNKKTIETIAGNGFRGFESGGQELAKLYYPTDMAYDSKGNLFIVDSKNHAIRKLDSDGNLTVFAGSGSKGFVDGNATAASFNNPFSIVIDTADNLYISDSANHKIRAISPDAEVTTVAGTGTRGYADGPAFEAKFYSPMGLAIDKANNIYIADRHNHRIRKLGTDGVVTTVTGGRRGYVSGGINFANFNEPYHIAIDSENNLYVSDRANHKIRKISNDGYVSSIAGFSVGYRDGRSQKALFNSPKGLAIYKDKLYVADSLNNRIRTVDLKSLEVETIAGAGFKGFWHKGSLLSFNDINALRVSKGGELLIADSDNHRIRKIDLSSLTEAKAKSFDSDKNVFVTTLAGNGIRSRVDGLASYASFNSPYAIIGDQDGNLFVSDKGNHVIRRINKDGEVSTFAGSIGGFADDYSLKAKFNTPSGLAIDSFGDLYVADRNNHRIRKITRDGQVSTFAGTGSKGSTDGKADQASFNAPCDLAFDQDGNLLVADSANHKIRKISSDGQVSTLAGYHKGGFKDGYADYAKFRNPHALALDSVGNIYVADYGNHRVRKIDKEGFVTTLAGSGAASFQDGDAKYAQLHFPIDIAVDSNDDIYVADYKNNRIRKISAGKVSSVAGYGLAAFADATGNKAAFNNPSGLYIGANDEVYVADASNNKIRVISSVKAFAETVLGIDLAAGGDGNSNGSGKGAASNDEDRENTRPALHLATDIQWHSKSKDTAVYLKGTNMKVKVFAFDLEDKSNIYNNITWTSSEQGFLGEGKSFNIKDLDLGSHRVVVKAIDSSNLVSTVSFNIEIVDKFDETKENSNRPDDGQIAGANSATENVFVKIISQEGKILRSNKVLSFSGVAVNLAQGAKSDISSEIKWSSDIDGDLGSGDHLNIKLSPGIHNITATTAGVSDTISVEVFKKKPRKVKTKKTRKKKIKAKPKAMKEIDLPETVLPKLKKKKEIEKKEGDQGKLEHMEVKIRML